MTIQRKLGLTVLCVSSVMTWQPMQAQEQLPRQTQRQERAENREQRQNKRQDNRQENDRTNRPDTRQDGRQDARQDNRETRQDTRQSRQRLNLRGQYYTQESWDKLNTWMTRNQVPERTGDVAGKVANAAERAVNVTERVLNTTQSNSVTASQRYGFNDGNANTEAQWFYDYYTYDPTYYMNPIDSGTSYGRATRYYDLNNDGEYDSLSAFDDSDKNGAYEAYDRYDFADADPSAKHDDNSVGIERASWITVTGKVQATKTAKVNGTAHLLLHLSGISVKEQDFKSTSDIAVDVGPVDQLSKQEIREGESITAAGPVENIGDKQILVANSLQIGDEKVNQIQRGFPKLEGQVVDTTTSQVRNAEHTLAIVESGSMRRVVDLGPTSGLKMKIQPQTKIVVEGVPVRVRNRSMILADKLEINGQNIDVKRW